jgi:hypothetical protein
MKHLNSLKKLLLASALLGVANVSNAQIHPLAFGPNGYTPDSNWYKDYVGLRFQVSAPSVIAGSKEFTAAWSGTTPWGAPVTTPLIDVPVIFGAPDSFGCAAFTTDMTGKIAAIWRGPITTPCEFGYKALQAQTAGAVAVIIINQYPGAGPIGMAAGTSGGSVTIPVFMMGNLDGLAMSGQYNASPGSVKMTITPWGINNNNDLGFVPGGAAAWANYAVPYNQLNTGTNPNAYKGLSGAFIANYGKSDAKNVKVASTLSFTPNSGGGASVVRRDTTASLTTFTGTANATPDSIYAFYAASEYNMTPSGPGRYDLQYNILTDTTDQYPLDNSTTLSFYASDSVYSLGRYDFTSRGPVVSAVRGPSNFASTDVCWGPMYFVARGGTALSKVQFSIYSQTLGPLGASSMNLYAFKWADGTGGNPTDSIVQNGELTLVSMANKAFNGTTDTSGVIFTAAWGDPTTSIPGRPIFLDSNAYYYIAAEVPANFLMYCDGMASPYPRMFGRAVTSSFLEYSSLMWNGGYSSGGTPMTGSPTANFGLIPFSQAAFIQSVDSFNYAGTIGTVPAVALIVNNNPDTTTTPPIDISVKQLNQSLQDIKAFPNPAADYINLSVNLSKNVKEISYAILDGLGRFVTKEVHNNVQTEEFRMSTKKLAPGNYYLIITADGVATSRKFAVIK